MFIISIEKGTNTNNRLKYSFFIVYLSDSRSIRRLTSVKYIKYVNNYVDL